MDAWERWRIVCLAGFFRGGHRRYLPIRNHDNRSSADWIRLCPGLSKNSENRNSCPKPHKAARKGKLMVETRMDRESSRGIGMRLLAPRLNNRNLIFFGSPEQQPRPRSLLEIPLGRALQWDALAFLPLCTDTDYKLLHTHTHTHTHKDMHSPPHPRSLASVALNRQPDKRVCDQCRNSGCGTGWLLAGAGLLPQCHSCVFMVYVLLCWRCFSCSHTVLPKEHSLGVIFIYFFLLTFLMLCCIFFLPLSTYISLLIIPCMTVYVTNNKEPWDRYR